MNKKAIVIGGTSGMGKEVVHILVREGWTVGVAGRREGLLQELEEAHPGRVVTEVIDVTEEDAENCLGLLIDKLGGMDLFLLSSGYGNQNRKLDREIEERTVRTNVMGFTVMVDAAFRWFRERGCRGHIAAITSVAGCKGLALVALCALAMAFAAGCVGIHSDPDSDLPGNAPASWEGKTLGVPI